METEHFQAPFSVITLGRIQIENVQIEKPSTKEFKTAWLLSKLHVIRQLKNQECKHYKTAVLVEKNLAAFLACHRGSLRGNYYCSACQKKN